jgi:hypothetical protein
MAEKRTCRFRGGQGRGETGRAMLHGPWVATRVWRGHVLDHVS